MIVRRFENVAAVIGVVTLLWAAVALAAATPAEKCEAAKLNAAGKYGACRLGAEKKAVLNVTVPDYTKCDAKYATAWGKAETKYGVACPTSGDQGGVQTDVTDFTTCLSGNLGGTPASCAIGGPAVLLATGQITAYGPGSDGALQEGTAPSYTDNGDGTITDNKTGLMWEKKSSDGSIHDYGNSYTWSGASYGSTNIMDGTITATFLATLNAGSGFAGHTDWRIPNRFELESIENLQNSYPTAGPAFNTSCAASCTVLTCSCTLSGPYWSSTTYQDSPPTVWGVTFIDGSVYSYEKSANFYVRAVRGGL